MSICSPTMHLLAGCAVSRQYLHLFHILNVLANLGPLANKTWTMSFGLCVYCFENVESEFLDCIKAIEKKTENV